jgi:hypothetical protein
VKSGLRDVGWYAAQRSEPGVLGTWMLLKATRINVITKGGGEEKMTKG